MAIRYINDACSLQQPKQVELLPLMHCTLIIASIDRTPECQYGKRKAPPECSDKQKSLTKAPRIHCLFITAQFFIYYSKKATIMTQDPKY